jgi:hypothetical protein
VAVLVPPVGRLTEKSSPVPLKLTNCVLPEVPLLLSVTISVPLREPPEVGVKVTLIVQEAPAATLVPQLLVCAKFPLAVMLATASAAFPELDRVTDWEALVDFTEVAANVSAPGVRLAIGP